MYSFEIIPLNELDEVEFNSFIWKTIFTTIPWINFIAADNQAKPIIIRITRNKELLGYFSGLIVKKFGMKILGSPFRGWSTCFMGFDVFDNKLITNILPELLNFIFKNTKCIYFECTDRNLSDEISDINKIKTKKVTSLELAIDKSNEELLNNFKGDGRNFIRQFEKRGATIEIAEPNNKFAEEYYEQLRDVFAKQGLVPTYGLDKIKKLLHHLEKTGMLLCLRVKEPNGKCIATSIFPGYKNKFFFFGGASYREFQFFRPNEYMIWYAIKYWRDRGLKVFDMVGDREYKLKFGSEKIEYNCIIVTKYQVLIKLRDFAERVFFFILKIKGSGLNSKSQQFKYNHLILKEIINSEIMHFAENGIKILSKFNKITIQDNLNITTINLPIFFVHRLFGYCRLYRRLLRLDKSVVIKTNTGYVAFWQGNVYHIGYNSNKPLLKLKMTGCRNPMHNSIADIDGKNLYFGEYGRSHPKGKSIYHSPDGGMTWEKVFNISCEKIRHIHACKWDPFEEKIWIFTGDFDGQCYILCADKKFEKIEWIGDGTQYYRAVDAIFKNDSVQWIMDSPLSEVRQVKLDRKTRTISFGQVFPGPVWYLKQLDDGVTLACSIQEVGPSHKDNKAHLFATRNLKKWVEVAQFEHDGLKKGVMKFGVGAFAEGIQTSEGFFMHFEAIKKLDGKVCYCSLIGI